MHDLNRTVFEFEPEEGYEAGNLGYETDQMESPFSEVEEMELASQLLEVTDEYELDQFLGGLLKKARGFFRSPVGRSLGGILKGVARKALPVVGGALGSMVAPGIGTAIGSKLASTAGSMFGLELEGLSQEDQEFEVARRFVRFAGAAAQNAAAAPPTMSPAAAAKAAAIEAAKVHAPGLLSSANGASQRPYSKQSGRWVRKGNKIVLYGIC